MNPTTLHIRTLIRTINKHFANLIAYDLTGTDITVPQALVLRVLTEEPLMVSTISEKVNLSNSTVSGIIDRLVKANYIERVRDPKDRRIVWVTQTDKLVELREKNPVFKGDYFDFLLEELTDAEINEIYNALELLSNHMQAKVSNHIQS